MQRYEGVRGAFFINNTVVCEAVWTCARGYKYSKHQIISLLKAMLSTIEFQFEDEGLLWSASAECEKFSFADLPDVLIGLLNVSRGCKYTITFDKKASSLDGFKLL